MSEVQTQNRVILAVSEDGLIAELTITDFSLSPKELLQEVKDVLKKNRVTFGIDVAALKKVFQQKIANVPVVVAKGIAPQPPQPPEIQKLIEFGARPVIKNSGDERVDYKELLRPDIVKANTPLVKIIPGKPGKPGKDVFGNIIPPAEPSDDLPIQLGENVAFSKDDPYLVIATKPGLARLTPDGKVDVLTTWVIDEDIDYETGNIHFPGNVIIKGEVKSGFVVEAEGDVEIYGTVGDALVEAGNDIRIKQGFTGAMKGILKAGRDVTIGFAHNQYIEAGRDVIFQIELVRCQVKAGRSVISKTGRIVGGECEALENIIVKIAGSEEEISTRLVTGKKSRLQEMKKKLDEKNKEYYQLMEEVKQNIYQLVLKKIDKTLSPEELEKLEYVQKEKESYSNEIPRIEEELTRINQKIERLNKAYVQVNGIIYPRVEIEIGSCVYQNEEIRRYLTYRVIDEKIKALPI